MKKNMIVSVVLVLCQTLVTLAFGINATILHISSKFPEGPDIAKVLYDVPNTPWSMMIFFTLLCGMGTFGITLTNMTNMRIQKERESDELHKSTTDTTA